MPIPKNTSRQLANCFRLIADILEHHSVQEALTLTEKALAEVARHSRQNRRQTQEEQPVSGAANLERSIPESPQAEMSKAQGQLAVKEFGKDIMSDDVFPTRQSLVEFARLHGVTVSERDSKAVIRHRLMSKAELRNMDMLMRSKPTPSKG